MVRFLTPLVARLPQAPEKPAAEESSFSIWVLVAANLLPLYGVLFWHWEVFPLLLLFWIENVVIGVLNVARMLLVDPADPMAWLGKLLVVPFFCFHYGMFTSVHGIFVLTMFGGKAYDPKGFWLFEPALQAARDFNLWLPLGALAASHLFSFLWNYLYRGEFRRAGLAELMGRPYKRVILLHVTILFGGFAVMALHSPIWALVLLVGIKIAVDVAAHRNERQAFPAK
jgi:Family of unknown function (DUF6498)